MSRIPAIAALTPMQKDHWYVAELINEITVSKETKNVVHRDLILIQASSPQAAYIKATRLGTEGAISYDNPKGQHVNIQFRGISKLDFMYEEPGDGSEVTFHEEIDVSEEEIQRWIPPKEELIVFLPPQPSTGPDYTSKDILDEAAQRTNRRS
jgi:hypothetical protein